MAAVLKMVPPSGETLRPAVAAVEEMAAKVQVVCRVFTASFVQRLATLNSAVRALRAMGYRVVDQQLLPPRGGQPLVKIHRGPATEIGPLLAKSTGLMWSRDGVTGVKRGFTDFQGVTVTWEEA